MMLEGWHKLQDGRDALYAEGVCVASIRIDDAFHATESWSPDGVRSLRNLGTLEAAKAHCERVTGWRAEREGGVGPGCGGAQPGRGP